MRAAVDEAGGDGAALAVLAPLPLARQPNRSIDVAATMDRLGPLVDAGVTDVLAHVPVPASAAAGPGRVLGAGRGREGDDRRLTARAASSGRCDAVQTRSSSSMRIALPRSTLYAVSSSRPESATIFSTYSLEFGHVVSVCG